jgi:hypothetical protein
MTRQHRKFERATLTARSGRRTKPAKAGGRVVVARNDHELGACLPDPGRGRAAGALRSGVGPDGPTWPTAVSWTGRSAYWATARNAVAQDCRRWLDSVRGGPQRFKDLWITSWPIAFSQLRARGSPRFPSYLILEGSATALIGPVDNFPGHRIFRGQGRGDPPNSSLFDLERGRDPILAGCGQLESGRSLTHGGCAGFAAYAGVTRVG